MKRLLSGSIEEAYSHYAMWFRKGSPDKFGNNGTGQRCGQYIWNMMGKSGESWPELFYQKSHIVAMLLVEQHYRDSEEV